MRKFNTRGSKDEFHFIYELYKKGDFSFALKCLLAYVEKYPRDFDALLMQGKLLRLLKQNEEAKNVFFRILSLFKEKKNVDISHVFYELVHLELDERNYKEAFTYFNIAFSGRSHCDIQNFKLLRFFLLNRLGLYDMSKESQGKKLNREDYSYHERQILDYQEDDLWNYLKSVKEGVQRYGTTFLKINEEVDYVFLGQRLKEILPYAVKCPDYGVFDSYIFSYPDFAEDENGEKIDYIRIFALQNDGEESIVDILPFQPYQYRTFINSIERLEAERLYDSKLEKNKTRKNISVSVN